jgi:hypothetical protein
LTWNAAASGEKRRKAGLEVPPGFEKAVLPDCVAWIYGVNKVIRKDTNFESSAT